ncbi:MAG: valine--tRNA ligase [candidate division WOR-3 bacterium]
MFQEKLNDFPTRYDPKPVEEKWYRFWEEKGFFTANPDSPKPKFSIVIPPPNVTGSLHMGHALDNTLPDILIRRKKMQGYETLWLPGTDHAGIGTQVKVEQMLAREGKTRFDLGREEFLKRAWEWKEKYGQEIVKQLRRLGCCLDWSRFRFTLDEVCARAVREAFVRYYEKGLIYRGLRIVNWCPRCLTALSDLEVKDKDERSFLWYIRYPLLADKGQFVVVATTRPETMLGDTAVAVNPNDERYRNLIGKKVLLPLTERQIPIIADPAVEMEFGTGAVKVTPAHDPVDFEIGERHSLDRIKVIGEDARMTSFAPKKYQGMTREECRQAVVEDLKAQGLLEKIEDYSHAVGICDRCGTVIEPLASEQWFVKMKPLAEPAIKVVEQGKVRFYPERWTKVYLEWMGKVKDWCISRQLWWGHRIPVWYCECGETIVAREDPSECPKCHSQNLRQDEDVLDTWFSSALWPFATMGWPEETVDYRTFFPTDFLTTDPDIIFRWEARMIFSSIEFTGRIPFTDVYIHSTVLDRSGARMSRSKGVGVDPLLIIDKYGTDACRFTIAYLESQSQSYRLWNERFELGRNFTNKIWNAGRLIAPFITGGESNLPIEDLSPVDNWILQRFNQTLEKVNKGLDQYTFASVAQALYDFFWHDLCDWYLEFIKSRLKANEPVVRQVLISLFRATLQLLHPIIPFITEELWHRLRLGNGSILESSWPGPFPGKEEDVDLMERMRELISEVRQVRAEMRVPVKSPVECVVNTQNERFAAFLKKEEILIKELAKVSKISFSSIRPPSSSVIVFADGEVYIPLAGVVDVQKELSRLSCEAEDLRRLIFEIDNRLNNADFLSRAKREVIERDEERRAEFAARLERLERQLSSMPETKIPKSQNR